MRVEWIAVRKGWYQRILRGFVEARQNASHRTRPLFPEHYRGGPSTPKSYVQLRSLPTSPGIESSGGKAYCSKSLRQCTPLRLRQVWEEAVVLDVCQGWGHRVREGQLVGVLADAPFDRVRAQLTMRELL